MIYLLKTRQASQCQGTTRIHMWDTVGLRDIQLQYSNDNSIYSQQFDCTLSKKQKERSEAGTGTELILQAHAVSFYLVRWRCYDDVLEICSVSVFQLGYHVVELHLLAGDGGEGELSLSLGEPESGPVGPEGRKAHGRPVDVSSLGAVQNHHVGVTNVYHATLRYPTHTYLHTHTHTHIFQQSKSLPKLLYNVEYVINIQNM